MSERLTTPAAATSTAAPPGDPGGADAEYLAKRSLRSGSAVEAAEVLWAGCHGLVSLLITKPSRGWSSSEGLMKVMLDGLLHGLVTD